MLETRIGMVPDVGGCVRLTRLVGPGRAADLIATARRVDGEEAYRLGVVERVVATGSAMAEAREAARQVAANGPTAVRLALGVVRMAPDLGAAEAFSVETGAGVLALTSGEPREGIAAFQEKRAPRWT
jgi:enoyl-CoA hydratase/carnithine racemase